MKYKETSNKINKLYNKIEINEDNVNKLEKIYIKEDSIHHFEKIRKYETDWTLGTSFSYSISLLNFPERLLPYIKITPIVKTLEAYETGDDYFKNFTFYYKINRTNKKENTLNDYNIYVSIDTEQEEGEYKPIYCKIIVTIINEEYLNEIRTNKS